MEKASVLPSGSLAVGWKEYSAPTVAEDAGVPDNTGGRFVPSLTAIENAGNCAVAWPSLTPIAMLSYVRTSLADGVPCNSPVDVLNVAHEGMLVIENVSALPSASDAVGVKLYGEATVAVVGGVPLMTGGEFVGGIVPPTGPWLTFEKTAVASVPSKWLVTARPT